LLFCFVSWSPRPPRSPLFPYTTLFRSGHADADLAGRQSRRGAGDGDRGGREPPLGDDPALHTPDHQQGRVPVLRVLAGGAEGPADRKSTRLNSSHVKISYAVFCLKKKK